LNLQRVDKSEWSVTTQLTSWGSAHSELVMLIISVINDKKMKHIARATQSFISRKKVQKQQSSLELLAWQS